MLFDHRSHHGRVLEMMRFFCLAALLATAAAFTAGPSAFHNVGEKSLANVAQSGSAHRTRRATIVMDGKANGE